MLSINWTEPSEPNGIILHYNYTLSETTIDSEVGLGSTTETSVTDVALSGVVAFTNYTVSVVAINTAGAGQKSAIILISAETGKVKSFY